MMASKVVKAVWLVLAIAGSAGLVLWMSEHGDLTRDTAETNKFEIVE
jgi:hypothetical protein